VIPSYKYSAPNGAEKHDFAPGLIQPLCRDQLPDLVEIGKKHEHVFFSSDKRGDPDANQLNFLNARSNL
jgi:hypothetical protein